MQVTACGVPCGSGRGEALPGTNGGTDARFDGSQVVVGAFQAIAVVNYNPVPTPVSGPARLHHGPVCGRKHRCSAGGHQIKTRVQLS